MGISTEEAIEALMEFGLSKEEAEIYLLLVENQSMTVRELNQKTPSIQRTYLYNFLDKLARNGWVHIDTLTKPQSYNPYDVDLEEKVIEKEHREYLSSMFMEERYPSCTCHLGNPPCSYCTDRNYCEYCDESTWDDECPKCGKNIGERGGE